MVLKVETFLRDVVRVDLEVDRESRRILKLAAIRRRRSGDEDVLLRARPQPPARLAIELDRFSEGATAILGHNLLHHDLPVMRALVPDLHLLSLPVIDTLYLSALAFPEKPYHHLVKDYRLVRHAVNDPEADARLATQVFLDCMGRFQDLAPSEPELLRFYARCFRPARVPEDALGDLGGLERAIRNGAGFDEPRPDLANGDLFRRLTGGRACNFIIRQVAEMLEPDAPVPAAYVVAWLRVAGEGSVLPPWILQRFPVVRELLDRLRQVDAPGACPDGEGCPFCTDNGTAENELQRYFGFSTFRPEPKTEDGGSLQRHVTSLGLARRSQLAVLATGAGKSICYQLPALSHYRRRGLLTLVISPLQALMKDQVENLNRRIGVERAAALYGLLTPPERGRVLERVRAGDVAILYLAPEQLRNRSFRKLIEVREIATWVFDEAHCLSKWGHDFRPDYLYAASFIREMCESVRTPLPAVACYTATAKKDVVQEILEHFRVELGLSLELSTSDVERRELRFAVESVAAHRKLPRIVEILRRRLPAVCGPSSDADGTDRDETDLAPSDLAPSDLAPPGLAPSDPTPPGLASETNPAPDSWTKGSAVVYFASRKGTEEAAQFLRRHGIDAAAFHAGLSPPTKRDVLDGFTGGDLAVVCATNAFGMGIDKEDVRLVIHADIPGSLEAYLQEAGRAGRDRRASDCILLFDEQDVERQFKLAASSKLEKYDLEEILRTIRREIRRRPNGVAVLTPGEILRDEELDIDIRPDDWQADTQIRIAVAWLERAGFLIRRHNRTWVFQGKLNVRSLDEARQRLDGMNLSPDARRRRLAILKALVQADDDAGLTIDDLAEKLGPSLLDERPLTSRRRAREPDIRHAGNQVVRDIQALVQEGLLAEGLQLTAYVRPKGRGSSSKILEEVARLEGKLLDVLQQEYPDAEPGTAEPGAAEPGAAAHLSLRLVNQRLIDEGVDSTPIRLQALLKSLSEDGKGLAESHGSLDLKYRRRGHYTVRLRRSWEDLRTLAGRRRHVARVALDTLLAKLPPDASGQALAAFSLEDVVGEIQRDLVLSRALKDPLAAAERALLFLHEHRAVQLQNGLAVFRQAMTLELSDHHKGRRYTFSDYRPLAEHYDERTFQTHVMARYAREAEERLQRGLDLIQDYFKHGRDVFVAKWFHDTAEDLRRATGSTSYRMLVDELGNAEQQAIVTAPPERNMLILAGPGSGKTRVVVHRAAYLLRVERVPSHAVLIVCFNRAASLELRRRLKKLVGRDAYGVTVCTYHGLAMRLLGRSFAHGLDAETTREQMGTVIPEATALLQSGNEDDATRDELLAGFRHILVDEYQDINEDQYRLIAAVAGRSREEPGRKLSLLAVGDDDQTIYSFNGADLRFIRRFQEDYQRDEDLSRGVFHLVQCYRSSGAVIAAANHLISFNDQRMKTEHPIRVDDARRHDPPGEPVRIYTVRAFENQAAAVVACVDELRAESATSHTGASRAQAGAYPSIAILARRHSSLDPVEFLLRFQRPDMDFLRLGDQPPPTLTRIREIHTFLETVRSLGGRALRPSEIRGFLPERETCNLWHRLLHDLVDGFCDDVLLPDDVDSDSPVDPAGLTEFAYDFLAEQRREPVTSAGVVLATVHAAKGLEFDHVLLLDSGWTTSSSQRDMDDERRLYYVGMTRAKHTLHLFNGLDSDPNPHVRLLGRPSSLGPPPEVEQIVPRAEAPAAHLWMRRRERIGLDQIYLSWAARGRPETRRHIRTVPTGAAVELDSRASGLYLVVEGNPVAKLSRKGKELWKDRLGAVESASIYAWVLRSSRDESANFSGDSSASSPAEKSVVYWHVPIVDVILRPDGALS